MPVSPLCALDVYWIMCVAKTRSPRSSRSWLPSQSKHATRSDWLAERVRWNEEQTDYTSAGETEDWEKLSVGHWLIRSDLKSINYNDRDDDRLKWRCRIFCSHSISFRDTFRGYRVVHLLITRHPFSGQIMEYLYSKRYSLIFIESAAASVVCLRLVVPLWIWRSSKSVNQTNTDRSRCLFALGDNYTSQHPVWCTRLVKYSRIVQLSSPAATDWDVFFLVAA